MITEEAQASLYATQATLATGVAINAGTAFMVLSSPQGAFSMINQFQLILLLPMINDNLPENIVRIISGMSFTLLSFDFIPLDKLPIYNDLKRIFGYSQHDEYMSDLGMKSGSAFINQLKLLILTGVIALLHT